jgi:hypothetical protein
MKRMVGFRYLFILLFLVLIVGGCGNDTATTPTPPSCSLKYVYDDVVNGGQVQEVVDSESDYNGTSNTEHLTLTVTKSQTITVSHSDLSIQKFHAQLNVQEASITETGFEASQAQAIYDSVHEINNSVVMTKTATIGDQFNITVGPWSWGYGNYGVFVQVASGHLYSQNCPNHVDLGNILTFTPIRVGWCVWVRGPNFFTDNSQSPCPTINPVV